VKEPQVARQGRGARVGGAGAHVEDVDGGGEHQGKLERGADGGKSRRGRMGGKYLRVERIALTFGTLLA